MPFESVHNYYESLVFTEIRQRPEIEQAEDDFISDVACVALNQLPVRYMRHKVDMVFYMTPKEQSEIKDNIKNAIDFAVNFVKQHNEEERPLTFNQQ